MKYVRTKDGHILKVGETTDYGFAFMPELHKAVHFLEEGYEYVDIDKKADTIEQLCDYALYEERGMQQVKRFPEECNLEFIRDLFLRGLVKNLKFAILTTKGIINEAKMNEKGELELL